MKLTEEMIREFHGRYPGTELKLHPPEQPTVALCIQFVAPDKSYSSMIALVGETEAHYHEHIRELHFVRKGRLQFEYRDLRGGPLGSNVIGAACHHEVMPRVVHSYRALDDEPAEVHITSWPAWNIEDHHLSDIPLKIAC
jgi:mannose-6-phosphate isomerase-like protein (cupin superfamily)